MLLLLLLLLMMLMMLAVVSPFIYQREGARTIQIPKCIDFEHHLSYTCKGE
jgi:hypothetical protein